MRVSWTSLGTESPTLNCYEFHKVSGGTGLSVPPSTKVKCAADQFERFNSVEPVQLLSNRELNHITKGSWYGLVLSNQFGSLAQNQT